MTEKTATEKNVAGTKMAEKAATGTKITDRKKTAGKSSVKLKITAWITVLMAFLFLILLIFMLIISRQVVHQTAVGTLSRTVQSNLSEVELTGGSLEIGQGFSYSHSGVTTLIYSKNETLLAGQVPVAFTSKEPFQNGLTRTVESQGHQYLVMDLWRASGWEDGVWVRGLLEIPEYRETAKNLLLVALVALPAFLLLTALGGWLIVRRTFRPLDHIAKTASTINEARDLSGRIGLPPGKDEFSRLAAVFDGMFERLETSFDAELRFTADASHELRTPVSVIKGACEYAEKFDETPEERRETIAMIHRQADKMASTISQLLSMTRLEQGTEAVRMEPTDLAALVRSVCSDLSGLPEYSSGLPDHASGLPEYSSERPDYPPPPLLELEEGVIVQGDAGLLSRLLRNLIENAIKYGGPDVRIRITVGQSETEATLSVKDDGTGIPPEHQEKIWHRFYQVDAARSGAGGAGLGLAMVKQIAQLHGGTMTLNSAPGEGSDFTLHLPLPPASD